MRLCAVEAYCTVQTLARSQAANKAHEQAVADLETRKTALTVFEQKHVDDTSGEQIELSPEARSQLSQLRDSISDGEEATAACAEAVQTAYAAAQVAAAAVTQAWTKTQVYWCKGLPATLDGLLAARAAGLPIDAVCKLSNSGKQPPAEGSEISYATVYDALLHAQHGAAWDDACLCIAAVDVAAGPFGGRFVPAGLYDPPAEGELAAQAPVIGAAEMLGALRLLERAAVKHAVWREEHTMYELAPGQPDDRVYARLADMVPAEQASVPVLLHCMLEQVCSSATGSAAAQSDARATLDAATRFDNALNAATAASVASKQATLDAYQYSTVFNGDLSGMAARGVLSGFVQPPCKGAQSLPECHESP